MPELPHFNPHVSVFHFSSKVSSAKIAKYKLATERGMVVSQASVPPARESTRSAAQRTASTSQAGTNKRPRLRLSVREPEADTINVARPPQNSTGLGPQGNKKRAWTEAFSSKESGTRRRADSNASSDLSSVDDAVLAEDDPTGQPSRPGKGAKDGYGDFMSYYVLDDDEPAQEAAPSSRPATKKRNSHASKRARTNSHAAQQPAHQQPLNAQPYHQYRPPPPELIAMQSAQIDIRPREPDSVPVMIMKLEGLSAALTDFGGVPPIPQSPEGEEEKESPVDNFLAMFGEAKSSEKVASGPLSFDDFQFPGVPDSPLTFGIQFIMNALKSWAEQRVFTQMNQPPKNRPQGRPKPTDPFESQFQVPTSLFDTPEGRAIAAFRAVVESGCLRVNSRVPLKLSKALRHLYMQIDHLINQTPKGQPPWRCLSYVAQIEANRIRVEKWRDAQAKAQEEMIRQQQMSHQQMMRQMGLPDHLTSTMFYHHSQDHGVAEEERKAGSTDLVRLPNYPRQSLPTTGQLPGASYASYAAEASAMSQPVLSRPRSNSMIEQTQPDAGPGSTAFLPRSGQSMKFSFAPTNTAAIEAFGAQAFPDPRLSAPARSTRASIASTSSISSVPTSNDSSEVFPMPEANSHQENIPPIAATRLAEHDVNFPVWVSGFSAINRPSGKHGQKSIQY